MAGNTYIERKIAGYPVNISRLRLLRFTTATLVGSLAAENIALAALGQSARPRIRAAMIPTDAATAILYGKALGYFERAGIDVTLQTIASGPAIAAAVLSGSVDIGFSNCLSLEIAHTRGLPVTILAGAGLDETKTETAGLLAVLESSPIHSAKELNGKTVALGALGSINDLALRIWMDANGGDSKTLRYLELPLPEMPQALSSGRVAAASMTAVGYANATKDEYRIIGSTYASISPSFDASAWFASRAWVDGNRATAKTLVAIIKAASIWANAHPSEAIQIVAKYGGFTRADLEKAAPPVFATAMTPLLLQPSIDSAAKYGFLPHAFPASDLIDPLAATTAATQGG